MKKRIALPHLGILTALASSLCCIMPVLALVAGTSGLASTFSWLEPARPYFIGASVLILVFAWYQKLKPQPMDDCGCHVEQKVPFLQTKTFLSVITAFSILLTTFPSYAHIFFPKNDIQTIVSPTAVLQKAEFAIEGMTCAGCEAHVSTEINKLKGIIEVNVSYEKNNAIVQFDNKKTTIDSITAAINATGYSMTHFKILNNEKE